MDRRFPELVTGSVAALRQRLVDFEPGHVVVMTPDDASEQWVRRCLVDISPLIGVEVTNPGSFVNESAAAAFGEPIPETSILSLIREWFADRPMFRELFVDHAGGDDPAGRDSAAARSWLNGLQQQFVELHRALGDGDISGTDLSNFTARDRELFEGFLAFRDRLNQAYPDGWWSGTAPSAAIRASATLPALRDLRAVFLFGFSTDGRDGDLARKPVWLKGFLAALCNPEGRAPIPVVEISVSPVGERSAAPQLRACQNPEAEIAEIARMLRAARTEAAVFVPADEVGRWTARLLHRDIPVRARVPRPMAETAVLRMLRALVQVAGGGLIHKSDMTEVLFSPVLRAVNWGIEQVVAGKPVQPAIYPEIRKAWQEIRRRNRTLEGWVEQLDVLADRRKSDWAREDSDATPSDARVLRRQIQSDAVDVLKLCIRHLNAASQSPALMHDLLVDWKLRSSVRVAPVYVSQEVSAAEGLLEGLRTAGDSGVDARDQLKDIYDHLNLRRTGYWIDRVPSASDPVSATPGRVMILPYEAACIDLPAHVYLCGLDVMPPPVQTASFLTHKALKACGIESGDDRYSSDCARLDRLVSGSDRSLSWRTRDARGGATIVSAWTMTAFPESVDPGIRSDRFRQIGIDAVAAPAGDAAAESDALTPVCRLELDVLAPGGGLRSRVDAIRTHETLETIGPWTGDLGVSFRPSYYSVSSLQEYNQMPYGFFLKRVLALSEEEDAEDSPDALAVGTVIHSAMEVSSDTFRGEEGLIDVSGNQEDLGKSINTAVKSSFTAQFDRVMATAVWDGTTTRWGTEVGLWWDDFVQRMDSVLTTDPRDIPSYKAAFDGTVFKWIEGNNYIEFGKWYEEVLKTLGKTSAIRSAFELESTGKKKPAKDLGIENCERIINWLHFRSTESDPCWLDEAVQEESFGGGRCSARMAVKHHFTPNTKAKKDPIEAWNAKIFKDVGAFIGVVAKEVQRLESLWLSTPGRYIAGVEFKIGSRSSPLPLKLSDDLTINIYGSVDRLEYDDVRNRLNICDYKTGSPKNTSTLTSEILSGTHLQLPLYAIAVDQMVGEALPHIKKTRVGAIRLEAVRRNSKGERPVCALRPDAPCGDSGLSVVDVARVRAAQAVNGVESGRFPIQRLRTGFESQADEVVRVLLLVDPPPLGDGGSAPDGVMAGDGSEGGEVTE